MVLLLLLKWNMNVFSTTVVDYKSIAQVEMGHFDIVPLTVI